MTTPGGHQRTAIHRVRVALLVSGLRWRARSSLAMFAVAVFATGAAAFGPIYLHSADQLVLRNTLAAAAPGNTGLTIRPTNGHGSATSLAAYARTVPEPGGRTRWWGTPILTQSAGFLTVPRVAVKPSAASSAQPLAPLGAAPGPASAADPIQTRARIWTVKIPKLPYRGTRPFVGSLVARTGVCKHLDIVDGTCPKGDGVVVSTRTAQTLGLSLGGTLRVVFIRTTGTVVTLPIVGVYIPGRPFAPYWWDQNFFGFGSFALGATSLTNIDSVFATPAGIHAWAPAGKITVMAQVPYRKGTLTVDAVHQLESDLFAFESSSLRDHGLRVSTPLVALLGRAASVEHAAATVVDIAGLELVLLGILVLYFVASRTAAEREPDVRVAELRGFGSRSTIAVALAEPVTIVAAAVPIGLLGAWLVAGASATTIFGAGIGVPLNPLSVATAIAAGVVGVAAATLGARRSLAGGLSAAAGSSASANRSRWAFLGDAAVVGVAGAAFFELVVTGDSGGGPSGGDPLAAFAPGLLAVALGVIVARALPWLLSTTHRRTAFSRRIVTALATRTVARRREYSTQLVLVALAVALTTFAVSGWVVAARNRDQRAAIGVGAVKVLTVSVRQGTTFLHAVRAADPSGRHAMAVVVERASDGTTLAVDARRLAKIATWPADLGLPAAQAARRLKPAHLAPPVRVTGTAISANIDVAGSAQPPPRLAVDVYDTDTQFSSRVVLGPLRPGAHRYTGRLFADCPGGCRLLDLAVTWSPPTSAASTTAPGPSMTIDVTSLSERTAGGRWTRLHAGLADPHRWRALTGVMHLHQTGAGLAARFTLNRFGTPVTIGPADVPKALPVVVTPLSASTASGHGGPLVVGLDGSTLPGHTVGTVPFLPGVGAHAVLTDLAVAERYLFTRFAGATTQVWLSRTAPSSIIAALRAHGVRVVGTATAAAAIASLSHSGLTLAYLLYLVAAIAAGLLVVAATAFALSSAARRRQWELAALRAVGVDSRALRRAVRAEQGIVLGAGILTGLGAGITAAAVALRSVPEFVQRAPGPPLQLGLPVIDLVVTIGAVVAALAITVFISTSVMVHGASVERLAGGTS